MTDNNPTPGLYPPPEWMDREAAHEWRSRHGHAVYAEWNPREHDWMRIGDELPLHPLQAQAGGFSYIGPLIPLPEAEAMARAAAEAMREACAELVAKHDLMINDDEIQVVNGMMTVECHFASDIIRALPLPAPPAASDAEGGA